MCRPPAGGTGRKASLTRVWDKALMRRRTFLAAVPLAAFAATPALAGGGAGGATMNLSGVGLPVISGGRVRNYVFLTLRLHLAAGQDANKLRAKEPYFRDALVRAGHRKPFTLADDWSSLNATAISAALMRAAPGIAGRGVVARAEVVAQAARRQIAAPGR